MIQSTSYPSTTDLSRLEDITTATTPVAMLKQEPIELSQNNPHLIFSQSYDGLDYLDFVTLTLPTGENITLVRHHNCPAAGTEICIATKPENATELIDRTCEFLRIGKKDLVWIHPAIQT
jgi:hypothetical protein